MWRRIRTIPRRRIRRMTPTLLETSSSPRTLASSRLVPCRPPCSVCSCLGAVISSLAGIKIVRAYAVHAVLTPRISSSPYILHLQNINFYLVYIIIINRSETRNMNSVDWSSHFPLYILFLSWQGLGLMLFGTLSQMSAITYIMSMSNLVAPCLQFFGRNPGWSPMIDIQVFFAPWGSLIMTDLLVVKSGIVL